MRWLDGLQWFALGEPDRAEDLSTNRLQAVTNTWQHFDCLSTRLGFQFENQKTFQKLSTGLTAGRDRMCAPDTVCHIECAAGTSSVACH